MEQGEVISVSKSQTHTFSKYVSDTIMLLEGLGVAGDAHMGEKVKHRSRVAKDPNQPNLRQVHLIHSELFDELKEKGFDVLPGQMGENITTRGIDLLNLPKDALLSIGEHAIIQVTGLRNPCNQINSIQYGLLDAVLGRDQEGNLIRKTGIMGIIVQGGEVCAGDKIIIHLPQKPHVKLERV